MTLDQICSSIHVPSVHTPLWFVPSFVPPSLLNVRHRTQVTSINIDTDIEDWTVGDYPLTTRVVMKQACRSERPLCFLFGGRVITFRLPYDRNRNWGFGFHRQYLLYVHITQGKYVGN